MHLIFDQYHQFKDYMHTQKRMELLGIKYQYAVPQSLYACWWFFNCTNIPEILPEYLWELKINPEGCIGYGLSKDMVDNINNWKGD